jgi:hypothetical protein
MGIQVGDKRLLGLVPEESGTPAHSSELRHSHLGLRNLYRVVGPEHLQPARTSLLNPQAWPEAPPAAAPPGIAERWSSG